jgi:polysaccharide export outer membrane protein
MNSLKTSLAAMLLFWILGCLLAQTREPDALEQVPAVAADAQVNPEGDKSGKSSSVRNTSPEIPYTRDAFSTTMTGAQVALGAGDQLEITVFDTPELTQRVRVNSDGKITLALVGEITVRGMLPDVLSGVIARKLIDGNFMKNPQVSVFVLEYAGQMAYVTGEVNRPGAYALLRSHRLLDLISVAGGLTSRAGNEVSIVRGNSAADHLLVDLNDKDQNRSNPEVLPGDSITVGQTGIVYVLGDVQRPGGFMLDRRTTLSVVQAVALAEGAKPSAALAKTVLIRTSQGKRQEIPLNLKMILKSQSPDLLLAAGDIVFIPGSLTRGMGRTSLEVIESSAGLAAVYATRP